MSGWGAGSTANDEARVRRAARAFPPRWRAHSEEELVRTAVASPVTRRVLADIALAGWRERHRDRPPLWSWLLYSVTGRMPQRWWGWMRDDLDGRWVVLRGVARKTILFGGTYALPWIVISFAIRAPIGSAWFLSFWLLAGLVGPLTRWEWRAQVWLKNGMLPDGRTPVRNDPRVIPVPGHGQWWTAGNAPNVVTLDRRPVSPDASTPLATQATTVAVLTLGAAVVVFGASSAPVGQLLQATLVGAGAGGALGYWLMLRIVRCDRARPVRPSLHSEERQSQLFVTLVGVPMLIIAMVALAIESAAVSLSVEVLALTVGIIATLTSVAARRSPRADPFTVRDLWERPRVSVGAGGPPSGSG